ncbi:MAG: peptidase M64 [Calditrichaeota bacterium]|nr:MAG: peptidase M64 [Calditrichota bacterium]
MRVHCCWMIVGALLVLQTNAARAQDSFARWFFNRTLRIDLFHTGGKKNEQYTVDRLWVREGWNGPSTGLADPPPLGLYQARVEDLESQQLIYARGFSTLFNEWQTTAEAGRGAHRTFGETLRLPLPRRSFRLSILRRDANNRFTRVVFQQVFHPDSLVIHPEPALPQAEMTILQKTGNPQERVDVVFVAEGYTANQRSKFLTDARRMMKALFSVDPFLKVQNRFNCYAVFVASPDSGVDEPGKKQYRTTPLNASFGTFGLPRYLMTDDNRSLQNIAEKAPFDAIVILVNTNRYGGGGIYNLYACTTVDNPWSTYVMVHEFGHSFAGLGDEYFSSTVAYQDFYPEGTEPWEPNLTALADPAQLKWKHLVEPGTPIPTPWDKATYEAKTGEFRRQVSRLRAKGASEEQIRQAELTYQHWLKQFFASQPYAGKVGAFEGGGYVSSGIYRPALNCIMFSKGLQDFDPVCQEAITRVIDYYTGRGYPKSKAN